MSAWPAVIVVHGWSTNASEMLPMAQHINEAGFAVLTYDARGHGMSDDDGPITIRKVAEDIIAAVDYVQARPDVDGTRVGVVGHSMGGSAAIVATSVEQRIRALVSSSAFADPLTITRDFLRSRHVPRWPIFWLVAWFIERWLGATIASVAPQNCITNVAVPVLLLHGESDRYVSASNLEILSGRADPERVCRKSIPGRGHTDMVRDRQIASAVVDFLREHLCEDRRKESVKPLALVTGDRPSLDRFFSIARDKPSARCCGAVIQFFGDSILLRSAARKETVLPEGRKESRKCCTANRQRQSPRERGTDELS